MNIFLSPHDDDNILFGAFTCMRENPLVVIVTDSYRQPLRGEVGCDARTRAEETERACGLIHCPVLRLHIPDNELTTERLIKEFGNLPFAERVYAPMPYQEGNPDHNLVGQCAGMVPHERTVFYTTYTRDELWKRGRLEVVPTKEELELKERALQCYQSQINLAATRPHFEAVRGKSEWLL